jgi:hypothetical protein
MKVNIIIALYITGAAMFYFCAIEWAGNHRQFDKIDSANIVVSAMLMALVWPISFLVWLLLVQPVLDQLDKQRKNE